MRGGKGLTLCKHIRARDAHTPIVIFSGHAFASEIEAGMLAGANAYLVKPDSSELIPTIRRLCWKRRREAEADERRESV